MSAKITSMHVQAREAVEGGQHHHVGLRLLGLRVVKGLRFKVGLRGLSGFSVGRSAPVFGAHAFRFAQTLNPKPCCIVLWNLQLMPLVFGGFPKLSCRKLEDPNPKPKQTLL